MRKQMLRGLLIAVFALNVSVICSGQVINASTASPSLTSAQDSEILKLLEITKIQRDGFEQKAKLLEDRLAAKDEIIRAKDGTIEILEQQKELAAKVVNNTDRMDAISQARIEACQQQLSKADARIYSLEHPGILKSIFDRRSATGFLFGYGAGRLQSSFTK